jgi:hypothetical protein
MTKHFFSMPKKVLIRLAKRDSIKVFFYLLLLGIVTSCGSLIKIYHHDLNSTNILGGEIRGSDLDHFFYSDKNINIREIHSKKIHTELNRILKILKEEQNEAIFDDGFYEIAFIINSKDTLYTNTYFEDWRYKNLKMKVTNKIKILLN